MKRTLGIASLVFIFGFSTFSLDGHEGPPNTLVPFTAPRLHRGSGHRPPALGPGRVRHSPAAVDRNRPQRGPVAANPQGQGREFLPALERHRHRGSDVGGDRPVHHRELRSAHLSSAHQDRGRFRGDPDRGARETGSAGVRRNRSPGDHSKRRRHGGDRDHRFRLRRRGSGAPDRPSQGRGDHGRMADRLPHPPGGLGACAQGGRGFRHGPGLGPGSVQEYEPAAGQSRG